jgi:ATP-dependent helicase/nuclease subunit B
VNAAEALTGPGPRWFTIPPERPFLDDLAAGLIAALGPHGPDALSDAVVLTPTRRGARSLAEAFVRAAGGQAVLLPQVRALGDLDEGEPPFEPGDLSLDLPAGIGSGRRRYELARLVHDHQHLLGRTLDVTSALELGDALGALLDSCQIEEVADLARLEDLVSGDLARHWRISADFLRIAVEAWPRRLADLGLMDVAERRVKLLDALARQWSEHPPETPLIAAGSTGTAPATARLLAVVARAPQGAVVLPGLDLDVATGAWDQVGEQHPQGAMKRLLQTAGQARDQVRLWPASLQPDSAGRWRRRLVNEALRPAEATADWLDVIEGLRSESASGEDAVAAGLQGLSVLSARNEDETAAAAALLMREALEIPGKTVALVTPDNDLSRRVAAKLARWGLEADISAGEPLAVAPAGVLLSLLAAAPLGPTDPVRLLAVLKHPLVRFGREASELDAARRTLERYALRGPRREGWPALRRALADRKLRSGTDDVERLAQFGLAETLLDAMERAFSSLAETFAGGMANPDDAARTLAEVAEEIAGPALWAGAAGEAAAGLLSGLASDGGVLPAATPSDFAQLVDGLVAGCIVRTGGASHPRLRILGAIEARLVRADRLILAGLEEGVWPRPAPIDPFLSRPMRAAFGLPEPERRIGLSAHDFAQAAAAPEVVLLHTQRRGGSPQVRSRWLWRLETLARGAGQALPSRPEILDWARALDAPLRPAPQPLRMAPRPRPTPPLAARPRELPVTGVETWVRDPYAVYARYVLRLRQMDRPDEPVEARARGTAVHAAFEAFARQHPGELPPDAEDRFREMLVEALESAGMPAPRMARERALAANVAPWVVDFERRRRAGAELLIEHSGQIDLSVDGAPFKLTAKADRIELRGTSADILDFKTGAPPRLPQVQAGFSPQLTLTAAILARGGFAAAGERIPGQLVYVQITGRSPPGRDDPLTLPHETEALAAAALEGLARRIRLFDQVETPYASWAAPQFLHQISGDYDHLARVWEWRVVGDGGEGEA